MPKKGAGDLAWNKRYEYFGLSFKNMIYIGSKNFADYKNIHIYFQAVFSGEGCNFYKYDLHINEIIQVW